MQKHANDMSRKGHRKDNIDRSIVSCNPSFVATQPPPPPRRSNPKLLANPERDSENSLQARFAPETTRSKECTPQQILTPMKIFNYVEGVTNPLENSSSFNQNT